MHVKQQVSVSKIRKDAEDSYRNGFSLRGGHGRHPQQF